MLRASAVPLAFIQILATATLTELLALARDLGLYKEDRLYLQAVNDELKRRHR